MTNRHPPNVKKILASGIDSLVISMSIDWEDETLFTTLDELKETAISYGNDFPGNIKHINHEEVYPFLIKPHGTKGFTWILTGKDFTYKIANSTAPTPRPNAMIEFRSEALWRLGAAEVLKIALDILKANGGHIIEIKLSRVDLCVDFLMPEKRWSQGLMDYAVTRANDFEPHYPNRKFSGISIGKGAISARLYDKALEIQQQSKKFWMFKIWNIEEVPAGKKIIRIEFQLRREILKELGLNTPDDLFQKIKEAWAYCTKNWLKFQDRPDLHHTQQKTLKWYEELQDGFQGAQGAQPLVRKKAVSTDKRQLMQQANGLIMSLHAINQEEKGEKRDKPVNIEDCLNTYAKELEKNPPGQEKVTAKINKKRSKCHRE